MRVIFANWLRENFLGFDENLRNTVVDFIVYVESNGVKGLKGRNKSSALPNPHTKKKSKNTPKLPKNTAFGIIILAYCTVWHKRTVILPVNTFCIIVIIKTRLSWWTLARTRLFCYHKWTN